MSSSKELAAWKRASQIGLGETWAEHLATHRICKILLSKNKKGEVCFWVDSKWHSSELLKTEWRLLEPQEYPGAKLHRIRNNFERICECNELPVHISFIYI